jgi:hypothetical protein
MNLVAGFAATIVKAGGMGPRVGVLATLVSLVGAIMLSHKIAY